MKTDIEYSFDSELFRHCVNEMKFMDGWIRWIYAIMPCASPQLKDETNYKMEYKLEGKDQYWKRPNFKK